MEVKEAYNIWAEQYDTNENKTRDLEAFALEEILTSIKFNTCLEIGCGTGKNTEWIISRTNKIIAVDFSEEMLKIARSKIHSDKIEFIQADINKEWHFEMTEKFDLVIFSLVLEHIENLEHIFEQLNPYVKDNGFVYIGELHPFKQYKGSKARFDTEDGIKELTCFVHHISDYTNSARKYGFELVLLEEYFDKDDRTTLPRILTLLLKKLPFK